MGGNVFDKTAKIKREDIQPTLKMFYQNLAVVFPRAKRYFSDIKPLGSVGKKDYSGDIDLAMSTRSLMKLDDWGIERERVLELFHKFKKRSRTATNRQLIKKAILESIAEKIDDSPVDIGVDSKGSSTGTLFFVFPQYDEKLNKKKIGVQIDVNFGDVDWLEFAYHSATYKGNVKGLHRTQLIVSLFSNKGYVFSHNYGVKNRETQEIEANTPSKAVSLLGKLYGLRFTKSILGDYFKLMDFLKKGLSPEDLNPILDSYLRILDKTRADIPEELQDYWINNQDRLKLTGKFLPDDSQLTPFKA